MSHSSRSELRRRPVRSRGATFAILSLFAIVVLSVPVGLFARAKFGEPYPWLFQPSFGYVINESGTLELENPSVVAVTTTGETVEVPLSDLMPETRTNRVLLFLNNFRRDEFVEDPGTAEWITARLADMHPERSFAELIITWTRETVDLSTGERQEEDDARVVAIDLTGKVVG